MEEALEIEVIEETEEMEIPKRAEDFGIVEEEEGE